MEDIPKIENFKELLNEISWNWNYPRHDIIKYKDGTYSLDKLYISSEEVSYKTDVWILESGVFEEFEKFYDFLQKLERR